MRMVELERSSGGEGVRRSARLSTKRIDDLAMLIDLEDDLGEVEEKEEEWELGAGRRNRAAAKRGEKGTGVMSGNGGPAALVSTTGSPIWFWPNLDKDEEKRLEMSCDAINAVSQGLGVVKLSNDDKENLPQELKVDPSKGFMDWSSARAVSKDVEVVHLSSSESSDDGGDIDDGEDDDDCSDYGDDGIEQEIITTLSPEDALLFAEVEKVNKEGGDLKKLKVDHLKAYLRHHGLRIVGVKAVLLDRIQLHLKIKDGRAEEIYPRSSFSINCKGDVALGDTVLFRQDVYDMPFDIERRSASGPPLGKRWVAGKVVNESYGAEKQQHTFTVEVFWSTGTTPLYTMRPLIIKGRNLYREGTLRQPWSNEENRQKVLDEKHSRGAKARAIRWAAKKLKADSRKRLESRPRRASENGSSFENRRSHPDPHMQHQNSGVASGSGGPRGIQGAPCGTYGAKRRRGDRNAPHPPMQNHAAESQRSVPSQSSILIHTRMIGYPDAYPVESSVTAHPAPPNCGRPQEIACSEPGCSRAGAKQCITRSCAICCSNSATRGRCARHLKS